MMEDGRWEEESHGPVVVVVVVVGEIDSFFSITDGRPLFLCDDYY